MDEPPIPFDASAGLAARGARVCDFETADFILEEERQSPEVGVRGTSDEFAGLEDSSGYGGVVDETQVEEGRGVVLGKRVFWG